MQIGRLRIDNNAFQIAVTLTATLLPRLGLFLFYGPVMTPDSYGYRGFAEIVLKSSDWLRDAGLNTSPMPILAFRSLGYPLIVATTMVFGGPAWPYFLVALQYAVSLCTTAFVFRLAKEFGLSPWTAVFASITFATSLQLTFDQCVLTDSLHASAIIIAFCLISCSVLIRRSISLSTAAVSGVLFATAFLLREVLQFLVIVVFPLLLVAILATRRGERWRTAISCIAVLLPLILSVSAYKGWNTYRTGYSFVTTGGQATPLYALMQAARNDPLIFSDSTPLDAMVRKMLRTYEPQEMVDINSALFREGYQAPQIAQMATAHFFKTWIERPLSMLRLLRISVSASALKLVFRPITALCDAASWARDVNQCYEYRSMYRKLFNLEFRLPWREWVSLLAMTAQNVISVLISALFYLGVPIIFARSVVAGERDLATWTVGAFWAAFVGWYLAYAATYFEDRYMAPMIPFIALGGLYVARTILNTRKIRRPRHSDAAMQAAAD